MCEHIQINHAVFDDALQVYPDVNFDKAELTSYLFMTVNAIWWYTLLLHNLTFSVYGTNKWTFLY